MGSCPCSAPHLNFVQVEDSCWLGERIVRCIFETGDCSWVNEAVAGKAAALQIGDDLSTRAGPYLMKEAVKSAFSDSVRHHSGKKRPHRRARQSSVMATREPEPGREGEAKLYKRARQERVDRGPIVCDIDVVGRGRRPGDAPDMLPLPRCTCPCRDKPRMRFLIE